MTISLHKTTINDATKIHEMQIKSFSSLLEKYQDYDKNPGNEDLDRVEARIKQSCTDYYFIQSERSIVGAIRVVRLDEGKTCRISPIFVLPEHQRKGIAQEAMKIVESFYSNANKWILDTILQEAGNCHLYEKMGYVKTGKIKPVNDKLTLVSYEKIIHLR